MKRAKVARVKLTRAKEKRAKLARNLLCVLWDKPIKDFCTDFPQERMWVPWEATHQLTKSCN